MTVVDASVGEVDLFEVNHGVVVRPGDTLIVGLSRSNLQSGQLQHLREQLEERLPGVETLVVGDVAQFAVYRPDTPDPAPDA